jgi:uncharacterized membrane protein (DUF4010 family)
VCALLSIWLVGAAVLALGALLLLGNLIPGEKRPEATPGLTTEVAMLLTLVLGAYSVDGYKSVTVALGGAVAFLLHAKAPLHKFVDRMGEQDVWAIMQFVLIALVIWPVLPNEFYGPYHVLNPHNIWLMVVLIVGISLSGYVAYKLLGPYAGILLAGALGGLISSTATTASVSRQTKLEGLSARLASLVLLLASTVSLARVLVLVGVTAPDSFDRLGPPLIAFVIGNAVLTGFLGLFVRREPAPLPVQGNPAQMRFAIVFGIIYAVILIAVAAGRAHFGERGLYLVAILSGLHSLDAITISTAQFVEAGSIDATLGWKLILTAALANYVSKAILVASLGSRGLRNWTLALFGLIVAGGLVLLAVWR